MRKIISKYSDEIFLAQILNETWNFRVWIDDVVEFFGEIVANLFDESENMIAHLVLVELLLAENCQSRKNDAFEELQKDFVALSIEMVEALEYIFIFDEILAKRKIRNENWQHIFQWNQRAVHENQTTQSAAYVVQNSTVTFFGDQAWKRFQNLRICSVGGIEI